MDVLNYFIEHNRWLNLIGICVVVGICYALSAHRSRVNFVFIAKALLMQLSIGFLVLNTNAGQALVGGIAHQVHNVYQFAGAGISFLFGELAKPTGAWGFVFAIQILPVIIFFGALTAILFHFGIIQYIVYWISLLIRPILGTSGAETLCVIGNSFLGPTEAPLLVRKYLKNMTKSEMLVIMVSGMAHISGSILVVYASMGVPATHLLVSSIITIPASIMLAKTLYPEVDEPQTAKATSVDLEKDSHNIFDAIFLGTSDGMRLAMNVGAMLIAFLSLIAMLNYMLGWASHVVNDIFALLNVGIHIPELSLNVIFAYAFSPFAYLMGLTGNDALIAGKLLGMKVAINELIAYKEMVASSLSPRAMAIMTYALCGFSNFSVIGIQVGGIGALVPEKRRWLTEFGLRALLGGALANILSAMIIGLLI